MKLSCQLFGWAIVTFGIVLSGCCGGANQEVHSADKYSDIHDSPAARHAQALRVIEHYPSSEFEADTLGRIETVTGEQVSEEVRARLKQRLSAKELFERRTSLLTEVYDAASLAQLADMYATTQGKQLLRQHSHFDQLLRDRLSPLIMEVLSNAPAS